MPNTAPVQLQRDSVPRRLLQPPEATTVRSVWQDNPAAPRDRTASHQPASPQNKIRPHPFDADTEFIRAGRPKLKQTKPTTLHLHPRVRSALERKAEEQGLSVSATGAALLEWALSQSIYEQNAATLDKAVDTSIGRHMRTYSDRNASLQARTLRKVEFLIGLTTNILGRQQGIDEVQMERILNDADDRARASIKRTTPKDTQVVEDEKRAFEKGGRVSG